MYDQINTVKFNVSFQFLQQSPAGAKVTEDIKASKTPNTSSGPTTDIIGNIGKPEKKNSIGKVVDS